MCAEFAVLRSQGSQKKRTGIPKRIKQLLPCPGMQIFFVCHTLRSARYINRSFYNVVVKSIDSGIKQTEFIFQLTTYNTLSMMSGS